MSNSSKISHTVDNIMTGAISVVLLIMSQIFIFAMWGLTYIWKPMDMVISIAITATFLAVYFLSIYNLVRKGVLHPTLPKIVYGVGLVIAVLILFFVGTEGLRGNDKPNIQADLTVWITQAATILALYLAKRYGSKYTSHFSLEESDINEFEESDVNEFEESDVNEFEESDINEYREAKERITYFNNSF